MKEEKKQFEPFKIRPIRMSDKVWEAIKKKKNSSGLTWNKFISSLLKNEKVK